VAVVQNGIIANDRTLREELQAEGVVIRLLQPPEETARIRHWAVCCSPDYRVFQSASSLGLNPEDPGDRLYRFEAPKLRELNHRLAAQTYRFLQQHPCVVHWTVLVITPHDRLNLGPTEVLRVFLEQQLHWSGSELAILR